jgi:osmotically-inducible protein OsmY
MQKRRLSTIMGLTLVWFFWGGGPFGPLPVHGDPDLTDQAISDKVTDELAVDIREELWWSPYVDADDVTVTVDDGEAILTGKVDSWSEYSAVNENAYEAGAVAVDNELKVEVE